MKTTSIRLASMAVVCACIAGAAAQFPQLITDFEVNGAGDAYPIQPGSLEDLSVVLLQDPAEADVTILNIVDDSGATLSGGDPPLPSTEESFIAAFAGFGGANASTQFMDVRFEWASTDGNRWALIETLQSPQLGDPSLHLGGKVRFYVNIPDCAQFEYPGLFTVTPEIGVALLISETGRNVPLGFQDNDILNGSFEFVGVSSVAGADTANPVPVPTRFIPITDSGCAGATTGPAGNWRLVEFDLSTESVIGWSFKGGDGLLDATGAGDGVNRGVLAGIVLTVRQTDTTSNFVEFLVDQITFEAPVVDPAVAPSIASPVVAADTSVQINDVVTRATNVTLEVDRADEDNDDPFVADETFSAVPALSPTGEERFVVINVTPALEVGDRIRARQQINADIGPYSLIVAVNPPAAFTATLSLDEDGSLGTVAVFEWVGATSVIPPAGTQGKPVFPQNGVWQKLEYSLIPGVEPVISFAGGNGKLEPNGGLYNIDAMFFTIDSTAPSTGPYDIFIDHIYVIAEDDEEILISDAETANPFPNSRGQSTSINRSTTLSTLASFDGISSNRIQWEFPDLAGNNTHAPYRPAVTFADSAKAVGMWLLVEEPRLSPLPLPAVEQRIIGDPPAITVSNIDPSATNVDLLVNGTPAGSINPAGATSVDVVPTVALALRDSVSARYSTAGGPSDVAYPRVVQAPPAPTVQGPLFEGQTSVTVTGVLNTGNAVASLVSVYDGGTLLVSADPQGAAQVTITVPALVVGQQIAARQTVNGAQSGPSAPVGVGSGVKRCVVINELQYDDTGADDREFVELYNAEPDPVDISGWTLRASDTVPPPGDDNPDYVIPAGTILASGDYYVVGAAAVPNVDLVVTGANLWEESNEALELLDQNGVVVDTVVYELYWGPVAISSPEGGIWGTFQSIDGSVQSLSRWLDGFDTSDNGRDFGVLPATPGATNEIAPISPLTENFSGTPGQVVPNFIGSFVNLTYINPTVADASNPNAIPASPQGGNAAVAWDPSGGGNQNALVDEARFNVGFSVYVYIDASGNSFTANNSTASENEGWSIGLGSVDTFYNSFDANGGTGLMWEFFVEEEANTGNVGTITLQLRDRNNGGPDGVVLLDIPPAQITTGWHMLSIERNYESFTAAYDATSTSGTVPANGPSTLQMGYREFVAGIPTTLRPLTIDALTVTAPAPPTLGACCTDCGCSLLTEATCVAFGGFYAGDGTDCTDGDGNGVADACEAPPQGCPGDYDCDNDIDFFDIDLLLAALGGEQAWATKYQQKFGTAPPCGYLANCDADQNGSVDFFDIDAFLDLLGTDCP